MPSLKATLTLDGTQYDQALMRARAAAAAAGTGIEHNLTRLQSTSRSVGASINKAFGAENFHPSTGALREFMVILREIGRGNWSRVPGSLSILMSYLVGMRDVAAGIITPARAAADAYKLQALRANEAAIASLRKAQAAETAFLVEGQETEADFAEAVAARDKAIADQLAATASMEKAAAAGAAAEAAEAEAAATATAAGGTLGTIGIGLTALAVVATFIYEKFWGLKAAMQGMELPSLSDDYIPKIKRSSNEAAEAQKGITAEVEKTIAAYNSAAEAAQRVSKATADHYAHQRKLNELHKETELAGAKTPEQKMAIEKKYADMDRQSKADERNENLANKFTEKANLEIAARTDWTAAQKIKVPTKAEDDRTQSQLDENAKAAQAFLKGGGVWQEFKKQAAADFGGAPWQRKQRLDAISNAEGMNEDQANRVISMANAHKDKVAANDDLRKQKDDLEKSAGKNAAAAAKVGLEIKDDQKTNQQAAKNDSEEETAQVGAEKARLEAEQKIGRNVGKYSLNSDQKIGAYSAGGNSHFSKMEQHLASLDKKIKGEPAHKEVGKQPPRYGGLYS